jgi:hypothetical protein
MKWKVEIIGDNFDYEELIEWFDGSEIEIAQEGDKYFLKSNSFELLNNSSEIRRRALHLVTLINGVCRLKRNNFQSIKVGVVFEKGETGKENLYDYFEDKVIISDKVKGIVTDKNGNVGKDKSEYPLDDVIVLSNADEHVERVLRFISNNNISWNDLYRVLEIIEKDINNPLHEVSWLDKSSRDLFKRTANSYSSIGLEARHGHEKQVPPEKPMEYNRAKEIIFNVAYKWISGKLGNR